MPQARKETVSLTEPGVYHCTNRCVRGFYLMGKDPETGEDRSHRKKWIAEWVKFLLRIFPAQVLALIVMDNHFHVIFYIDPRKVDTWSDWEVARRGLLLYPGMRGLGEPPEPAPEDIARVLEDPERIARLRLRLKNLSVLMAALDENIARRANVEEGCTGRFWEGRFKCTNLQDEAALIACMAYVDLNQVRAGLVDRPELSEFCSLCDRVIARQAREKLEKLRQSGKMHTLSESELEALQEQARADAWLMPLDGGRDNPCTTVGLDPYLQIVDWIGRALPDEERGGIPRNLQPILERLQVDLDRWPECVRNFGRLFGHIAGTEEDLRRTAHKNGRKWIRGMDAARKMFVSARQRTKKPPAGA